MAKAIATAADCAAAGQTGTPTPAVERTAACETYRHAQCRGEVVSLLAEPGARCQCPCHQERGAA